MASRESIPPPVSQTDLFFRGLSIQMTIIGAILMRELHARYGRDNVGYLWMVGEPMILATIIAVIHSAQEGHHSSGIAPVPFAIIGYTIFIIFRGVFNRAEGALESTQPLLHHRRVSIFDIMFGRALIEIAGCFLTMVILLGLATVIGYAELPVRPLYLLVAVALMGWMSFGMSLLVVGYTYGSHTLGRLTHPFAYFMIPLSGAFWMLSWVPQPWREYLSWSPFAVIFETARYGQFATAKPDYVDPLYVVGVCAFLTYTGLIAIQRVKGRLQLN